MTSTAAPPPRPGIVHLAIAAFGGRLLHHLGALLGALAPYLVQLAGSPLSWKVAVPSSTAVIVSWLLANAHVAGKRAEQSGADVGQLVGQLLGGPGSSQGANPLAAMVGHLLGAPQPGAVNVPASLPHPSTLIGPGK